MLLACRRRRNGLSFPCSQIRLPRTGAACCAVIRTRIKRSPKLKISISCARSEEHTSELQSLMRISYAVFCLQKNTYDKVPTYAENEDRSDKDCKTTTMTLIKWIECDESTKTS